MVRPWPRAPRRTTSRAWSRTAGEGRARADETRKAIESGGRRCPSPGPRRPPAVYEPVDVESSASAAGSSSTASILGRFRPRARRVRRRRDRRSCGRRRAAASAARSSSGPRPTPRPRSTTRTRSTSRRRRPTSSPTRRTTSPRRRRSPPTRRRSSPGWSRVRRALPEVRAPRLPGAVVPELAVVRVPVPRLEVQPGRREAGWPGAARSRPLRRHGRRAATSSSTPASLVHRPADRHRHHRPGRRGTALCLSETQPTPCSPSERRLA